MYSINNVFDKVYLINLEQDTDKYQTMKNKLDNLNIQFELFKAIDGHKLNNCKLLRVGNKGAVGCKMSHMTILRNAKKNNYSKILILEDDIYFWKTFNEQFDSLYKELMTKNKSWKVLYLGGCAHDPLPKTNNNIWEIGSARLYGSQAIGFDNSIYDTILQYENDRRPYDDILAESINRHNYIFRPYLIYQNVNKQSTTSTINNKDQEFFNRLNSINPNNYL